MTMNRRKLMGASVTFIAMAVLNSQLLLASDAKFKQIPKGSAVIKGIHHMGISTSDLDRSLEFYGGLLGIEILGKGPFAGENYTNITGLKNAQGRMAMLRVGGIYIEIFEYERKKGKQHRKNRLVDDIGFNHLCFEVDDVHKEDRRLKQAGIDFHSAPQMFGTAKAVYGRDPDGNVFELVEWE